MSKTDDQIKQVIENIVETTTTKARQLKTNVEKVKDVLRNYSVDRVTDDQLPDLLLSGGQARLDNVIDALKKAGLREEDFNDLIEYKYEQNKEIYSQHDVERFSSLAYLFSLGLGVKNLSVIKSMSDRGVGFFETYFNNSDNDPEEIKIAIDKFSEIIGSYILEDL